MFSKSKAVSSFSVNDLQKAKAFYTGILGLDVIDDPMGILVLRFNGGGLAWVYPKPDHAPATFTVLNFPVPNVAEAVDGLIGKGIIFEQYHSEYLRTDEKGISRGEPGKGPTIAWFKDPSGNIMSVVEDL